MYARAGNHYVKLAFYPVLSQFRWVLSDMIEDGITFEGFESVLTMRLEPAIEDGRVKLRILKESGEGGIAINPLDVSIHATLSCSGARAALDARLQAQRRCWCGCLRPQRRSGHERCCRIARNDEKIICQLRLTLIKNGMPGLAPGIFI